ncbi:hypothetical protein Hanom_Chr04g00365491 [Helianthus anomalus]
MISYLLTLNLGSTLKTTLLFTQAQLIYIFLLIKSLQNVIHKVINHMIIT